MAATAAARRCSQTANAERSLPHNGVSSLAESARSGSATGASQALRDSVGSEAFAKSVRRIGDPTEELVVEQPCAIDIDATARSVRKSRIGVLQSCVFLFKAGNLFLRSLVQ